MKNTLLSLLDALDTKGGHIALLAVFTLIGAWFVHIGLAKADDIMFGSFSGMLLAMRGPNAATPDAPK